MVKPSIPVRIPFDDSTFNPGEYSKIVFSATGKLTGKIFLVHGGEESDSTGLGLISTRIWVVRESDKENIVIKPTFDNKTHTFRLEAPNGFNDNVIYHETMIQYPRSTSTTESLFVESPNTSFVGNDLQSLFFGSIRSALSNASITLDGTNADVLNLNTSNGAISGTFKAGHVELHTSNAPITGKLHIRNAADGKQSEVITKTSNGELGLHVTAVETARGLRMENATRNAKVNVGTLLGKADRASYINASTTNGKVDFNLDASQSGQPLEVQNTSSNGGIITSVMVPIGQKFKGEAKTSNAPISVNLTEAFEGKFEVETSNSPTVVEGSNITLEQDKKTSKRGFRVQRGPSEFKIQSSNSSVALRFYSAGLSMASDYQDLKV
ncbi:hypothetical protein BGZ46_007586 [Entomortierella lignicola]|nr:hypothetical protein BGZ46_007586 [Entomortierella lignicola]